MGPATRACRSAVARSTLLVASDPVASSQRRRPHREHRVVPDRIERLSLDQHAAEQLGAASTEPLDPRPSVTESASMSFSVVPSEVSRWRTGRRAGPGRAVDPPWIRFLVRGIVREGTLRRRGRRPPHHVHADREVTYRTRLPSSFGVRGSHRHVMQPARTRLRVERIARPPPGAAWTSQCSRPRLQHEDVVRIGALQRKPL